MWNLSKDLPAHICSSGLGEKPDAQCAALVSRTVSGFLDGKTDVGHWSHSSLIKHMPHWLLFQKDKPISKTATSQCLFLTWIEKCSPPQWGSLAILGGVHLIPVSGSTLEPLCLLDLFGDSSQETWILFEKKCFRLCTTSFCKSLTTGWRPNNSSSNNSNNNCYNYLELSTCQAQQTKVQTGSLAHPKHIVVSVGVGI